jgi:hypothetical protein
MSSNHVAVRATVWQLRAAVVADLNPAHAWRIGSKPEGHIELAWNPGFPN